MATNRELLFANNALTTLAGSISNTSVTANLAAGTGILFPPPGAGQGFYGTFTDAATGLIREIVLVTHVTGNTITMIRGQDGTSAVGWAANDLFGQLVTAGAMDAMVQIPQLQAQAGNYALDIGSVNTYLCAFTPAMATAPTAGNFPMRITWANSNTGASTLNAGWGAVAIKRRDGSALIGNEIVAGNIGNVNWTGTVFVIDDIAPATTAAVSTATDTQSAVTPAQLGAALGTGKLPSGECRLVFTSATSITLTPFNGNNVPNTGNILQLPAGGVAAANTNVTVNGSGSQNLAASSVYLVALNASVGLEYWSLGTGHGPSATAGNIGIEIILGHNDKTLVGMVATNGSSQFADVDGSRLVLSWFNRQTRSSLTNLASTVTLNTLSITELDASIRNSFLTWGYSLPYFVSGTASAASGLLSANTSLAFDGVSPELVGSILSGVSAGGSWAASVTFCGLKRGLSEGLHYATLVGCSPNYSGTDFTLIAASSAAKWLGGNSPISGSTMTPMSLFVTVSG